MTDFQKLRGDFPILRRKVRGKPLVYFDNAATTQKPKSVIAAITSYYESHNANIHRGAHALAEEATELVEQSRKKVASFINASAPESVIFTRNATEAINLVAHAWGRKFLKAGDEILLTEMEHHSNLVPWQMLAAEKGVRLRFIPVKDDGILDIESLPKVITAKTKLVAFTAASNALGTLNPVEALIAAAKSVGASTVIDGSQHVPHFPTDVQKWGCDFLAFSGHKMLGPTGVGVLWGKAELLEAMDPFLGGGDMIQRVFLERYTPNVPPHKFEAGTPNIEGMAAMGAAVDYLSSLDWRDLREHELALTKKAIDVLSARPGVTIYGPKDLQRRGGVVSFNIEGVHPHDAGTAFDVEGVAVRAGHHCCQPLMMKLKTPGTVRASFYLYNTLEEVDALGRALDRAIDFFSRNDDKRKEAVR